MVVTIKLLKIHKKLLHTPKKNVLTIKASSRELPVAKLGIWDPRYYVVSCHKAIACISWSVMAVIMHSSEIERR